MSIAASNNDGRNEIVALQAKRIGIPQVIAIIHDSDYISLLEEKGIVTICAPWSTAAMVENFLDWPGVAQLVEIGRGVAILVGVTVNEKVIVVVKSIREIDIPKEGVVAAVIRGSDFVVPRSDTLIEAKDQVIFVGPSAAIKKAQETFAVKR